MSLDGLQKEWDMNICVDVLECIDSKMVFAVVVYSTP